MIQLRSIINVADNSGARKIQCFHVKKGHYHKYATVGDVIVASVRDAMPNSAVKKGEKVRAVIVRTVHNRRRPDGSYIRFDDNAACLIDDNGEPRGTRVFGPVSRELRDLEYLKIISLAPEVV